MNKATPGKCRKTKETERFEDRETETGRTCNLAQNRLYYHSLLELGRSIGTICKCVQHIWTQSNIYIGGEREEVPQWGELETQKSTPGSWSFTGCGCNTSALTAAPVISSSLWYWVCTSGFVGGYYRANEREVDETELFRRKTGTKLKATGRRWLLRTYDPLSTKCYQHTRFKERDCVFLSETTLASLPMWHSLSLSFSLSLSPCSWDCLLSSTHGRNIWLLAPRLTPN